MTLTDFQSTLSECAVTVVASLILEYGTTDFSSVLSLAKKAETRLFVLILDQPSMAGQLLEQGFNMGLFREGTAIIGSDLITTPQTWQAIVKKENIVSIMKGFIGLQYSPGLQLMSSQKGQQFIKKFISQPNTRYRKADGTITCDSNSLDDSGDYFLYSLRHDTSSVCGGIDFSLFNASGANVYPQAAQVYDAVYAIAYAVQDQLVTKKKSVLYPADFYTSLLKGTNFQGASGYLSFTPGSAYYPYNNRGNREAGIEYLIFQFNEQLYLNSKSMNGSDGFGVVGVFDPSNTSYLFNQDGFQLPNGDITYKPRYNTYNEQPPVNVDVYLTLAQSTQLACYILGGLLFILATSFTFLTYRFRSYKIIHANQREMIYFVLFGAILFSLRVIIIGLSVSDLTCTVKMWLGHVAFITLYGVLFRQVWKEFKPIYSSPVRGSSKISNTKYSSLRSSTKMSVDYDTEKDKSMYDRVIAVVDNLLFYFLEFVIIYLIFATYFGAPHGGFLTQYLNLQTNHQYICTMDLPIIESVLYTIEGLLLLSGMVFCIMLRKYLDHLVESRANMVAIISAVTVIFIVCLAVFALVSSGLFNEDNNEIIQAAGAFLACSLVLLLLCSPPFYLILSMKHDGLLIHAILMDSKSTEESLLEVIASNKSLMYKLDRYGQNAFQVALEYNVSDDILLELVQFFLPFDPTTKTPIPSEDHGYAWVNLVQKDRNADLVEKILQKYAYISTELANSTDSEGRKAVNIASQACQRIVRESTYFCKRYEITTLESPVHLSRTCVVHLAIDHRHNDEKVALKLMKNLDQYTREVTVRKVAKLSNEFVVNILRTHDINDDMYQEEISRRGFSEYGYCIVMPCADRDLNRIITNEHIAGKEWGQIKSIAVEIAQALQHMHSNGVIHGDVKSKNIMRIGHRVKFIDFDASVTIGKDFVGAKYSSAFVPPEMIFFKDQSTNRSSRSVRLDAPSPQIGKSPNLGKSFESYISFCNDLKYKDNFIELSKQIIILIYRDYVGYLF